MKVKKIIQQNEANSTSNDQSLTRISEGSQRWNGLQCAQTQRRNRILAISSLIWRWLRFTAFATDSLTKTDDSSPQSSMCVTEAFPGRSMWRVARAWSAGLFSGVQTRQQMQKVDEEKGDGRDRCRWWEEKQPCFVPIFFRKNRLQTVSTCGILGTAYLLQVVRKRADQGWCYVDRAHQVNEWPIRVLTRLEPAHSLATIGFLYSRR